MPWLFENGGFQVSLKFFLCCRPQQWIDVLLYWLLCCSDQICRTNSLKEKILVLLQGFRGINFSYSGSHDTESILYPHGQKTERVERRKKPWKDTVPQAPKLTPFGPITCLLAPIVPLYHEFIKALIHSLAQSLCNLDFSGTPSQTQLCTSPGSSVSWQFKLPRIGGSSWRGGLAVRSTCCCWRGPRFQSQHWHSSLQPSRESKSSSDFYQYQTYTWWTHIHTGKILMHIK